MKTKLQNKIFGLLLLTATLGLPFLKPIAILGQNLTDVSPGQGMQGMVLPLTISGQNTNFLQASNVSVSLQQGTSTLIYPYQTNVVSNLQLSSTFGIAYSCEPGYYDMRVYDEIDGEMILEDAFQIVENPDQPELISIEPGIAEIGQTLSLLVTGQFTNFQASTTTVWLEQGTVSIYPNNTQTMNNSELYANFSFNNNHPEGLYVVHSYNSFDGLLTLGEAFTLLPGLQPTITGMQPSTAMQGSLLGFDIYGDNTHFEDASIVLAYLENSNNQIIELLFDNQYQIWTNEQIEGAIIIPYNSSPGTYDLHVYNNIDGSLVLPQAFIVTPNPDSPEILSINPTSCYTGLPVIVDAQAHNTWFGWGNGLFVSLKKNNSNERIWAESFEIEDLDQLSAQFSIPENAPTGLWDFTINDDICGEIALEGAMTIIDTIAGINIYEEQLALNLFPNPAQGHFKLSTPDRFEDCKVIIYNLSGQRKEFDGITLLPNQPVQFNIQNLGDGFYFVQVITNEKTLIKKLIKQ